MTLRVFAALDRRPGGVTNTAHIRAALLYADELVVQDVAFPPQLPPEPPVPLILLEAVARAELEPARAAGAVRFEPGTSFAVPADGARFEVVHRDATMRQALSDMFGSLAFAGPWVALFPASSEAAAALQAAGVTGLAVQAESTVGAAGAADQAEVALAAALLADLPAFPRADIDVILDVRERLADARTRFRAVMAAAATRFAELPGEEFEVEVARFRREQVDEALLAIREQLHDLGAVATLQRVASDRAALPATAALAVATVAVNLHAMLAALLSGELTALAARERVARGELRRDVRRLPYWYLHELDRRLG
jgi:hypothetical protein